MAESSVEEKEKKRIKEDKIYDDYHTDESETRDDDHHDDKDLKPFYLKDYKKGGKKLGAIVSELDTDKLLELFEKINEDSKENVLRREEMATEAEEGASKVNDVEKYYFKAIRGKHAKYKDRPKSFSFRGGKNQIKKEATNLIKEHVYSALERELGKDVAKIYRDHPNSEDKVIKYLAEKQIDFYQLRNELVKNPRHFRKNEQGEYAKMKQQLSMVNSDESILEGKIENELNQDEHLHDIKKWAGGYAFDHRVKIDKGAKGSEHLAVVKHVLGGGLINRKYLDEVGYVKSLYKDLEEPKHSKHAHGS